jgi:hypothetical protein
MDRHGQGAGMSDAAELGRGFAEALAAKDFDRIATEIVAPEIDFRGLTPRRSWEASSADQLVAEILTEWLEPTDHPDGLIDIEIAKFADRHRVAYGIHGHNEDGPFQFEQQAYFTERDGRIDWMRVVCSGFRPAP